MNGNLTLTHGQEIPPTGGQEISPTGGLEISPRKSVVHYLTLAIVWLTIASSAVVYSEPAPFDALMMGLILLLPVVGLVKINASLLNYLALWLVIGAAGLLASSISPDVSTSSRHIFITIYLSIASAVLAGFIARNPAAHARLILNAYLIAAIIASIAATIGYFEIIPGFNKVFTLYGRARGTFKDPNVFGAFLVPALIYCLHLWLSKPMHKALLPAFGLFFLSLGCLLSFSRGAWALAVLGSVIYLYLTFVTAKRDALRLKLILLCTFAAGALALMLSFALQFDNIANLISERATLDQSYDYGPEGRFGGQKKAINLISQNPLGIGARQFGRLYHTEETHNVYLSMFLNSGWVGGFGYLAIIFFSLILGLRHALRSTPSQGLFFVVLAAFIATAIEGWIIDTDHWRHFFILLALLWGLMIGERPLRSHALKVPIRP